MNITTFTATEIQAIQYLVPDMTPEEACNKVLRDWFDNQINLSPTQTPQEKVDSFVTTSQQAVTMASKPVTPA